MTHPSPVTRARAQVVTFLVATFVLSGFVQARIFTLGGSIGEHPLEVLALMWTPGLVGFACRLGFREGFADVSFRLGNVRSRGWWLAWLFPVLVGGIAYGAAWLSGIETFAAPSGGNILVGAPAPVRFLGVLALTLTVGVPLSAITAAGEELGWRGYLLTRLLDARVPRPILVSGLIWGVWHLPLIASGQYAVGPYPLLSMAMFMLCIVGGGILEAIARLETGSVWAAVLFHASWNAVIQGVFDRFTVGGDASRTTSIWIGESGMLTATTCLALALALVWRGVRVRRVPAEVGELRSFRDGSV